MMLETDLARLTISSVWLNRLQVLSTSVTQVRPKIWKKEKKRVRHHVHFYFIIHAAEAVGVEMTLDIKRVHPPISSKFPHTYKTLEGSANNSLIVCTKEKASIVANFPMKRDLRWGHKINKRKFTVAEALLIEMFCYINYFHNLICPPKPNCFRPDNEKSFTFSS